MSPQLRLSDSDFWGEQMQTVLWGIVVVLLIFAYENLVRALRGISAELRGIHESLDEIKDTVEALIPFDDRSPEEFINDIREAAQRRSERNEKSSAKE